MTRNSEYQSIKLLQRVRHPVISKYNLTEADRRAVASLLSRHELNDAADFIMKLTLTEFERWIRNCKE